MTEEQQAVAEKPDEQAPPVSEDTGAQETEVQDDGDNLDELLQEYETGTARQEEKPAPAETPKIDAGIVAQLESRLKAIESEKASEANRRDFDAVVDEFAKDSPLPRTIVAGTINQLAIEDPKIATAFEKRFENPQAWAAAQKRLSKKYSELQKALPDKELSENREAVANAVRGHSKRAPEQDDINTREIAEMSDSQFEAWVRTQKK